MKNYICEGKTKPFTASADVLSGEPVVIGDLVGVSAENVASGEKGEASVEGVFELPKKSADNLTDGLGVYLDGAAKEITLTEDGNTFAGFVYEPAGAATTSVKVKLAPGKYTVVEVEAV